ncbi:hypothetical protein K523DRAFT_350391 [Schizophyllum commune Tattone D]|nr:hypothetical protein K523DRAFT_350391 [Schizophyllum commune Tattone D]
MSPAARARAAAASATAKVSVLDNPDVAALWASLGNIVYKQPVTEEDFLAVVRLSPKGVACIISDRDNELRSLQFAHIFARAKAPGKVRLAEDFMGLKKGKLYVHNPRNVCFMIASFHFAFDTYSAFLCPTKDTLIRMLYAIHHDGLPQDTDLPADYEKNAEGVAHYRYTFPDGNYEYTYTPIMGEGAWREAPIVRQTNGAVIPHFPPFEGEDALPTVSLHLQPYFVVMHASEALLAHPNLATPCHLADEVDLIKKIGKEFKKRYDTVYAKLDRDSKCQQVLRKARKIAEVVLSPQKLRSGPRRKTLNKILLSDPKERMSEPAL